MTVLQNTGSLANAGEAAGLLSAMRGSERGPSIKQLEETLAGWWQELLGVEHVGIDDDFFQLGGHSLIGVALFAKIKETYGVELELSTLFDAKTVAELARVVSRKMSNGCAPTEHRPTTKELEETLTAWWQELLGVEHVGVDEDFFQLGGHSLIGVALFAKIKEAYGVELELSTLFDAKTVTELARLLDQHLGVSRQETKTWQNLMPLQPNGERAPLFWVPGGFGTSLLAFREVALLLGSDQPVYGFQTPMPEEDQEMESVPDRAARFVKELREVQPQGPYYLVGFCSGGFIAFEMAQQLVAGGQTVAFLGLIECYDDRYPDTWSRKMQYRFERMVWLAGQVLGRGPKGIVKWAFGHLASAARRLGGPVVGKRPAPVVPSEAQMFEKLYRSLRRYKAVNYPGKSVLLIGKESYHYCGLSESVDPRLVWSRLSAGGSEIKTIPGDHMELLTGDIVHRLADALKPHLPA